MLAIKKEIKRIPGRGINAACETMMILLKEEDICLQFFAKYVDRKTVIAGNESHGKANRNTKLRLPPRLLSSRYANCDAARSIVS